MFMYEKYSFEWLLILTFYVLLHILFYSVCPKVSLNRDKRNNTVLWKGIRALGINGKMIGFGWIPEWRRMEIKLTKHTQLYKGRTTWENTDNKCETPSTNELFIWSLKPLRKFNISVKGVAPFANHTIKQKEIRNWWSCFGTYLQKETALNFNINAR